MIRGAFEVDDRLVSRTCSPGWLCTRRSTAARLAAQLLGAAETIRLGAGASVMSALAPFVAQAEDVASEALGEAKFRTEFELGRGLARDAAVGLALGEPEDRADKRSDGHRSHVLGKREAEVAGLVAKGLRNKEIASRLFISERTVDSHVRGILNKLGVNSRAQVAAWVVSSGDWS